MTMKGLEGQAKWLSVVGPGELGRVNRTSVCLRISSGAREVGDYPAVLFLKKLGQKQRPARLVFVCVLFPYCCSGPQSLGAGAVFREQRSPRHSDSFTTATGMNQRPEGERGHPVEAPHSTGQRWEREEPRPLRNIWQVSTNPPAN